MAYFAYCQYFIGASKFYRLENMYEVYLLIVVTMETKTGLL